MLPLLIIGVGNIGSAFAHALLKKNILLPENLLLCDPSSEKLAVFEKKGCICATNAEELIPEAHTILLAIKPQQASELLNTWKLLFQPHQSIISMMAGISTENIQKMSGIKNIIRIMPNTPIIANAGIIGYFFTEDIAIEKQKNYVLLFNAITTSIHCKSEEQINSITALSGSGPAYYFRLMETMQAQAEEWGFCKEDAKEIALKTLIGAGTLAKENDEDFQNLREKITSKGGTTEAALKYFTEHGFETIWKMGMKKAKERAEELSK